MARLLEVLDVRQLPTAVTVVVGDVLRVRASGARVRDDSSASAVSVIGIFQHAVLSPDGAVVAPSGPPTDVLLLARTHGETTLDIMRGDPWHGVETRTLRVIVA